MVAVLAISESSRASLLSVLDRLGTNLLSVSPGQTFLGDDAALPAAAPAMIRRIGPVQQATSIRTLDVTVRRTDQIKSGETRGISVAAVETSLLDTLGGTVAAGRFLDAASERYPTVVLGSIAAQRLVEQHLISGHDAEFITPIQLTGYNLFGDFVEITIVISVPNLIQPGARPPHVDFLP